MQKWVILPVALIAVAISTRANAQVYGWLATNVNPAPVVIGDPAQITSPVQSAVVHESTMHGYPFNSNCCEAKSPCCQGLWDGYCGARGCSGCAQHGAKSCRLSTRGKGRSGFWNGFKGCGCGTHCGYHGCNKGGCGSTGCGKGGCRTGSCAVQKTSSKGSCSSCGHGGCKGACGCRACGPRRLGLFDWKLRHGKGCGCSRCAYGKGPRSHGKGCSSCANGHIIGSPIQSYGNPIKVHEGQLQHTPRINEVPAPTPVPPPTSGPAIEAPQPATVHVEPTSTSDRSANYRFYEYGLIDRPAAF